MGIKKELQQKHGCITHIFLVKFNLHVMCLFSIIVTLPPYIYPLRLCFDNLSNLIRRLAVGCVQTTNRNSPRIT